jgi:hypothetical protein
MTSWPAIFADPEVLGIKPARIFKRVVFPQPDGPTTDMNSPCLIEKLISDRACVGSDFFGKYTLFRFSTLIQDAPSGAPWIRSEDLDSFESDLILLF